MKFRILILIMSIGCALNAQIVARVGEYSISQKELSEEMNNFAEVEDLTYKQVRQMALDKLIEKYLLINYAHDNDIAVDEVELEAFFMRELGDLPRFQTNGNFSVAKYRAFLETENGQKIKSEMEKEILINKTRTLVKNSFNIADEQLLHQFLMDKIKIDLGYAIIDVEDANITDNLSLQDAKNYYLKNRSRYDTKKKVKLEFFLVFKDDFADSAFIAVQQRLQKFSQADSTLTPDDLEKLRSVFTLEETSERAYNLARQYLFQWANNQEIPLRKIETHYLEINEKMGNIPEKIIQQAFQMQKGEYSEPMDIGEAFIVFKVQDIKDFHNTNEIEVANQIWKDFRAEKENSFSDYREYYDNHIDKFFTDVAVVNIVDISEPPRFSSVSKPEFVEKMRSSIQQNIDDPYAVQKILKKNGLNVETKILYLNTFENTSIVENVIARMVNKNSSYGFLPTPDGLVFFQVLSYFPNYLPRFDDIREQLPNIIAIAQTDTTEFYRYFTEHKKDFFSPDSLQLGGVHFDVSAIADTLVLDINEDELRENYQREIDSYYRKRSVLFDFIFVSEKTKAEVILHNLQQGYPFSLLKFCFNENEALSNQQPVEYDQLPRVIRESLSRMLEGSIYQPVPYDNGWIVLNKIKEFPAGIIPFEEIKPELIEKIKWDLADKIAYSRAKAVFDSTSYFSHLFKFFDDSDIFETKYQNAEEDYEILGNLKEYKADLMRTWRNEKFSSIIPTANGYAVIYVLKKRPAANQTFEESLPAIEKIFAARSRFDQARKFVNVLRDSIMNGADPEELMLFFGGWRHADNLSLYSKIPGVDFSEDIMADVINRNEGYCSPVISINENQLLFYRIESYDKPNIKDFEANKENIRQNYIERRYNDWQSEYKAKLYIEIFN